MSWADSSAPPIPPCCVGRSKQLDQEGNGNNLSFTNPMKNILISTSHYQVQDLQLITAALQCPSLVTDSRGPSEWHFNCIFLAVQGSAFYHSLNDAAQREQTILELSLRGVGISSFPLQKSAPFLAPAIGSWGFHYRLCQASIVTWHFMDVFSSSYY